MSKYTMLLNDVLKLTNDIGLNRYPIFDENYRNILNNKITQHFRFYEIGFETIEMFQYYINVKMCEIMPKFNRIYKVELEMFKNSIIENSGKTNGNSVSNETNNSESSQTEIPINGCESTPNSINKGNGNGENISNYDTYFENVTKSSQGLYGYELQMDFIDRFEETDMLIINRLHDCFMKVY